jgi:hypothetical protein
MAYQWLKVESCSTDDDVSNRHFGIPYEKNFLVENSRSTMRPVVQQYNFEVCENSYKLPGSAKELYGRDKILSLTSRRETRK